MISNNFYVTERYESVSRRFRDHWNWNRQTHTLHIIQTIKFEFLFFTIRSTARRQGRLFSSIWWLDDDLKEEIRANSTIVISSDIENWKFNIVKKESWKLFEDDPALSSEKEMRNSNVSQLISIDSWTSRSIWLSVDFLAWIEKKENEKLKWKVQLLHQEHWQYDPLVDLISHSSEIPPPHSYPPFAHKFSILFWLLNWFVYESLDTLWQQ